MGLYDSVLCEAPLPWPKTYTGNQDRSFQTKDLDCCLLTYKITADGRLYKIESTYEEVRVTPEIAKERKDNKTVWLNAYTEQKLIGTTLVPMSFTGSITFYDFIEGAELDHWVEFIGLFSNGFLIKPIVEQNCTTTSNKERLEREAKFLQEAKERMQYLNTWKGKVHQFISRLMFTFLHKFYFKTLNKLVNFGYYLQKTRV